MAAADAALAATYGVSAAVIEKLRRDRLADGEHWRREDPGARVVFTEAGLSRVRELLLEIEGGAGADEFQKPGDDPDTNLTSKNSGGADADQSGSDAAEPEAAAFPVRCAIVRLMPNPAGVRVRLPEGTVETVRVRDNKRLRVRMLLLCQPKNEGGGWECVQPGIGVYVRREASAEPL